MSALGSALRSFSDQDVLFSQSVADWLGINLTDFKCVSVLEQQGPITAGKLADLTGLSTGAVTGVIDRLEKAGFVRRVRDPGDRRHVIIEANPGRSADFEQVFAPMGRAMAELCTRYKDAELGLFTDFITRGSAMLRDQTTALRAKAPVRDSSGQGELSAPLGSTASGSLRFSSGAARITLSADPGLGELLYRAQFEGRVPTVRVDGGAVVIKYPRFSIFDWRKIGAQFTLNAAIPWQLELRGGVSKLNAELSAVQLRSLELTEGVSEVVITLGNPRGTVPIRISGGVSNVTLYRPVGSAAQLQISGGASKLSFDDQKFGAIGGHTSLASPGYKTSTDRYDIELTGGISNLTIEAR